MPHKTLLFALFTRGLGFFVLSTLTTPFAHSFSTASPWRKWEHPEVRVCWMDAFSPESLSQTDQARFSRGTRERIEIAGRRFSWNPLPHEWKARIEKKIREEYTPERTGIHFTGWEPCIENGALRKGIHVVILSGTNPGDSLAGEADLGARDYPGESPGVRYLFLSGSIPSEAISPVTDIEATALHEFGHIAGLHHEQMRAPDGSLRSGYCGYAAEERFEFLTPVDRLSIMHEEQLHRVTRLGTFCLVKNAEQSEIEQEDPAYPECANRAFSHSTLALFFDRMDPLVIRKLRETSERGVYRHEVRLSEFDLEGLRRMYSVMESSDRNAAEAADGNPRWIAQ